MENVREKTCLKDLPELANAYGLIHCIIGLSVSALH